jgi:hypothetical protein
MKKQTRPTRTKDDTRLKQLTREVNAWRQATGTEPLPHDFKVATEIFQAWQAAKATGEPETVIVLKARVCNGELVLQQPAPLPVNGNEIRVGRVRVVVTLEDEKGE